MKKPRPLPPRMSENEFEYCWSLVVHLMMKAGILLDIVNDSGNNLAFTRQEFHDWWVDGVRRTMGMMRGFALNISHSDGRDGVWVTVHDDRRDSGHKIGMPPSGLAIEAGNEPQILDLTATPESREAAAKAMQGEINGAINAFLEGRLRSRQCHLCKQALGTTNPDEIARKFHERGEEHGFVYGHAACYEVRSTGKQVAPGYKWTTLSDQSLRDIVLNS